jgi:hypothetical protein
MTTEDNGTIQKQSIRKKPFDCQYYISWNADREAWDIDLDGKHGHGCISDKEIAIALAIREAQRSHSEGFEAVVYVENRNGAFRMEWSSS